MHVINVKRTKFEINLFVPQLIAPLAFKFDTPEGEPIIIRCNAIKDRDRPHSI